MLDNDLKRKYTEYYFEHDSLFAMINIERLWIIKVDVKTDTVKIQQLFTLKNKEF